jgi:hypothetical protein
MRLWTLHPRYLDAQGLVAAWREALLAQKVLAGETRGYTRHPQLTRFRSHRKPMHAIAAFLAGIAKEAQQRDYRFDTSKITHRPFRGKIAESRGQVLHEWQHLLTKLRTRAPDVYCRIADVKMPEPHPLFSIVPGAVKDWEKHNFARATAPAMTE